MPAEPAYLQNFSCFRDLTEGQRRAVARLAAVVHFPQGHVLSKEGKPGEHLYLITRGKVEVFYNIGGEDPTRVDLISNDEVIGCSALVPPFTYNATMRCSGEVEALEIEAEALRRLMREDCPLGLSIQQHIIQRLIDRIVNLRLEA
jgi:CRP-like cAMP-binding protein